MSSAASAELPDFSLIDLGPIGFTPDLINGWTNGTIGLNNEGEVVYGARDGGGNMHAWVWLWDSAYNLSAQTRHDLKDVFTNHPTTSIAHDINDDGLIVGGMDVNSFGSITTAGSEGILWNLDPSNREFHPLGVLESGTGEAGSALAISNDTDPTVAGVSILFSLCSNCANPPPTADDPLRHGFEVAVDDGEPDLPISALLPPYSEHCYSQTRGVNAGKVVGFAHDGGTGLCNWTGTGACVNTIDSRLWVSGSGSALNTLAGHGSSAFAINENGAIAGWGETSTNPDNDFCARVGTLAASSTATPIALPQADSEEDHVALGLNNATDPQVVGYSESQTVALLWSKTGGSYSRTDLNDVAEDCANQWTLIQAHDVNDDGWIVGYGTKTSNGDRAWLLIPANNCDGDANQDDVVDVFDLLLVLELWDNTNLCFADQNDNGTVDVFDLLEVLDNWGVCDSGTVPASLESLLVHAGLPSDADDDYLDILMNGTQAEIDNYNCWIDHYLLACGPLCQHNCPDDDPWGRH